MNVMLVRLCGAWIGLCKESSVHECGVEIEHTIVTHARALGHELRVPAEEERRELVPQVGLQPRLWDEGRVGSG